MNTADMKLDLFRRIDNLKDTELQSVYQSFLSLLTSSEKYTLTGAEREAIEEALESGKREEAFTHESVMKEAQSRYPQFKFK